MNGPDGQDAIETLVRATPVALKRVLVEIREIAQATAAHVARLAAFAKARWRARRLERHTFDANVDLGRRMAELGSGDAEQHGRIVRQQESIRYLRDAGAKTIRAVLELEAQEAKLAEIELQCGVPPPAAEMEFVAAVSARDKLLAQRGKVVVLRAAIRAPNRAHAVRLGAGYFIVCVLLMVLVVGRPFQRGPALGRREDLTSVMARTPSTIETQSTQPPTATTDQVHFDAERANTKADVANANAEADAAAPDAEVIDPERRIAISIEAGEPMAISEQEAMDAVSAYVKERDLRVSQGRLSAKSESHTPMLFFNDDYPKAATKLSVGAGAFLLPPKIIHIEGPSSALVWIEDKIVLAIGWPTSGKVDGEKLFDLIEGTVVSAIYNTVGSTIYVIQPFEPLHELDRWIEKSAELEKAKAAEAQSTQSTFTKVLKSFIKPQKRHDLDDDPPAGP